MIALAVGAVLIIGLFNVYKPQVKGIADKVFHKPKMALQNSYLNAPKKGTPVTNRIDYMYKGKVIGDFTAKGKFGEQNHINWRDYGSESMPWNWNIKHVVHTDSPHSPLDNEDDDSQNFMFGPNGTVQHVNVMPNVIYGNINYAYNGKIVGTGRYLGLEKRAYDYASPSSKSSLNFKDVEKTITPNSPGFPKGFKSVTGGNGPLDNGRTIYTDTFTTYTINVGK